MGRGLVIAGGAVLVLGAIVYSRRARALPAPAATPTGPHGMPVSASTPTLAQHTTFGSPGGAPLPSKPVTGTMPDVAMGPVSTDDHGLFYTLPEDAVLDPSGWIYSAAIGGWMTAAPLRDKRTGGFARLTYQNAAKAGALLGGVLLTKEDVDKLHAAEGSTVLDPCIGDTHDQAALASMGSRAWADKHDACVERQAKARGWDGSTPLVNAGKDWIQTPPGGDPSKATNYGWFHTANVPTSAPPWSPSHDVVQPASQAHNVYHTDYSQLTRLKRAG